MSFANFSLPSSFVKELATMNYVNPTPIQAQAIPLALAGKDILGSAQTGTGKTAAFGIPLVSYLMAHPHKSALVITPTRELASQVLEVLRRLINKQIKINTALLIGGDSMSKQLFQLRARPRLIVGTPGRINDHLRQGTLNLQETGFFVLDEADRMLDIGFDVQLEQISKFLPKNRQTLLFTATLSPTIERLSKNYLTEPQRIQIGEANRLLPQLEHQIIHTKEQDKYQLLLQELDKRQGSIIVFVKTQRGADRLSANLSKQSHSVDALHGGLPQRKRERVVSSFRGKKFRIIVATDVAARGLDIRHIEHVINYDLPQCAEDYVHRLGRTGRAGDKGSALCLISQEDSRKWKAINQLLNPGSKIDSAPIKQTSKKQFQSKSNKKLPSAWEAKPKVSAYTKLSEQSLYKKANERKKSAHTLATYKPASSSNKVKSSLVTSSSSKSLLKPLKRKKEADKSVQ